MVLAAAVMLAWTVWVVNKVQLPDDATAAISSSTTIQVDRAGDCPKDDPGAEDPVT
jgi:hypothetical protein